MWESFLNNKKFQPTFDRSDLFVIGLPLDQLVLKSCLTLGFGTVRLVLGLSWLHKYRTPSSREDQGIISCLKRKFSTLVIVQPLSIMYMQGLSQDLPVFWTGSFLKTSCLDR